jgi:hypothetical protein
VFSYYGTKRKLAGLYDPPICDAIIEPFAGAAGYSLHGDNWKRRVKLYDANPKIAAVWDWLIHADATDVLRLPVVEVGGSLNDYDLSDPQKWLIGFCINPGSSSPKITASARSKWPVYQKRIAADVHKIRHWTVSCRSYVEIPAEVATWYVDPPYQAAGKYYFGHGAIDFAALGQWCRDLVGQVMVCENQGADWLPFRYLADHRGSIRKNIEVIWDKLDIGAIL